jgi:hypothetical protein
MQTIYYHGSLANFVAVYDPFAYVGVHRAWFSACEAIKLCSHNFKGA